MVTANGEEHGLVDTFCNSCEFNDFKHFKPELKEKMKKEQKEHNRIEKYEYINRKGNFERLDKHYVKYAGDPILKFHLIPGYVYDLPVGFAEEVNGKTFKKRSELLSVGGENVTKSGAPLNKDIDEWEHKLVRVG